MATGFAVGLGSPRAVAILWTVAAGAAVALGASLTGPLTAEPAMVVAAIAIGTWFGAVVGLIVGRFAHAPRFAAARRVRTPGIGLGRDRQSRSSAPKPARVSGSPRS